MVFARLFWRLLCLAEQIFRTVGSSPTCVRLTFARLILKSILLLTCELNTKQAIRDKKQNCVDSALIRAAVFGAAFKRRTKQNLFKFAKISFVVCLRCFSHREKLKLKLELHLNLANLNLQRRSAQVSARKCLLQVEYCLIADLQFRCCFV